MIYQQTAPACTRRKSSRALYAGIRVQTPADAPRQSAADRLKRYWHSQARQLQGDAT